MPKSIVAHAAAIGARLRRIGTDFDFVERADGWDYVGFGSRRRELPLPGLAGSAQLGNAAVALALLEAAEPRLLVPDEAVRAGLAGVRLPGRFQVLAGDAGMDPGRRPQPAGCPGAGGEPRRASLRAAARSPSAGSSATRTSRASSPRSHGRIDRWIAVGLDGAARACRRRRSPSASSRAGAGSVLAAADVARGLSAARAEMEPGDRAIVFGSFLTVGPALALLGVGS